MGLAGNHEKVYVAQYLTGKILEALELDAPRTATAFSVRSRKLLNLRDLSDSDPSSYQLKY